jgi:hypothetical protein
MSGFRALLDEVADQANLYDVTDRAVAVARRRRRLQRALPVATAAVVLSIVAATAWVPRQHSGPAPAAPALAWLPAKITMPSQAPPLPPTPVGRGALIYYPKPAAVVHAASALLVTTTGRQYQLPADRKVDPYIVLGTKSLSPDGRWLVYFDGPMAYLRDLTGTARRALSLLPREVAWSADGHWLAVEPRPAPSAVSPPHRVTRIDLRTGEMKTYQVSCCPDSIHKLTGVLDDGRLVFAAGQVGYGDAGNTSHEFDAYDVDPAVDRATRLAITWSSQPPVSGTDHDIWLEVLVASRASAGGIRLLYATDGTLSLVDLNTRRVVRTYQVPKSHPATPGSESDHDDTWSVGGLLAEGILLVHQWFAAGAVQTSLELLTLDTGMHPVSQLPSGILDVLVLR